jgi:hypothetical protein
MLNVLPVIPTCPQTAAMGSVWDAKSRRKQMQEEDWSQLSNSILLKLPGSTVSLPVACDFGQGTLAAIVEWAW